MTDNISLELLQMMLKAKDAEILALRDIVEKQTKQLNENSLYMQLAAQIFIQESKGVE